MILLYVMIQSKSVMECSKASVMQENSMRCIGCKFQHDQYFVPNFGISQQCILRFSNGFQNNYQPLMVFHVTCGFETKSEYQKIAS